MNHSCRFIFGYLALFLLNFLQSDLSAQYVISGTIVDVISDEPIPFANIFLKGTTIGTTSDFDGKYKLESTKLSDSISVSYLGYLPISKKLSGNLIQNINFKLERNDVSLQEVVIIAGEDPAVILFRKIIKNKDNNRVKSLENFQHESYVKVELDLYDLNEKFTERKIFQPFKFIFDYIDSTSEDKPFLPIFISETLSDVYYSQSPRVKKEIIKAAKMSGMKNESLSQFLNSMQGEVDIYKNWVVLLDRSFASPISDNGLQYYKYYITDTAEIDGKQCFKMNFYPKGKSAMTFVGEFWVVDSSYAIKNVSMEAAAHINLNFIEKISVQQQYTLINNQTWMVNKDKVTMRFRPVEKLSGIVGRKTTSLRNIVINSDTIKTDFENKADVEVAKNSYEVADTFWKEHRHEGLSKNEEAIYFMVDSLNNHKVFKTYVDIIKMIISGYKTYGYVEVGQVFSVVSFNDVEGWRFRGGIRTSSKFSDKIQLGGHLAYGLRDDRFKYGFNTIWVPQKTPRTALGFTYLRDLDLAALNQSDIGQENLLAGVARRDIPIKLIFLNQGELFYEKEVPIGFGAKLSLRHRNLDPQEVPGVWDFKYTNRNRENPNGDPVVIDQFSTTEVSIKLRYAHQEKFLSGDFERTSLGSKKPIVELTYTAGVKGVIGSDFNYHRLDFRYRDHMPLGAYGNTYLDVFAGKIFSDLPYLLLHVPQGNETYFFNSLAFNMMNEYEFAADQYAAFYLRHFFEGYFLNRIPGVRKLKLREVISFKGMIGDMSSQNREDNSLNNFIVPNKTPYLEASAGIANILKLFRIDFNWRLTYRNNPNISKFGIRAGLSLTF